MEADHRVAASPHPGAGRRPGEELAMSLWDVMVSIFWFFVLFAWIWLLIAILGDIFRDHELSGWGKAGWTLFLIVLPWLGALTYLIVRGKSMNERALAQAQRNEERSRQYIQDVAASGPASTADELAKLADLHDRGAISDGDYEKAKTKVLS
jgi:Short C-terminal domain/Phospholipase_D-nuclease N-terminal